MTLSWDRPAKPTPTTRTSLLWDCLTGDVREVAPPLGPDEWIVDVEWEVVGGLALPVALTVRSSHPTGSVRGQWLQPTPKAVTREVTRWLPVGEIMRRSRKMLPPMAAVPALAELAEAAGRADSRSDWVYRETAKAYLAAEADPRTPRGELARVTWELLKQHPDPRMYTDDRVKVRKWIARARSLGYLPPSSKRASAEPAEARGSRAAGDGPTPPP